MSILLAIATSIAIAATMKDAFAEESAHDLGITLKAEALAFRELNERMRSADAPGYWPSI